MPGVLTTDPRKVSGAQLIPQISCDEMLELSSLGAAVLHPRAVEIARNYGVALVVRSSWSELPGTKLFSRAKKRIGNEGLELGKPVDHVELFENQGVIALAHIADEPGVAADLFDGLGKAGVNIDLIVQATHDGSTNDIAFTLSEEEITRAKSFCCDHLGNNGKVDAEGFLAKLSIGGAGIMGRLV